MKICGLRCFPLAVLLGWLGWCGWSLAGGAVWAQPVGKVSLFVTGEGGKHSRAAAWVEGVWVEKFHQRLQDSETFLGGVTSEELESLAKARKAFAAGKKAYEDLNPDLAFRKFREAIKLFETGVTYLWDMEMVSRAWLYVGVSHLLSGKQSLAEASFRQALLLQPNVNIRKVTTESDKGKVFSEVKSQLGLTPQGVLEIRTTPHAAVFVNGSLVGATPVRLRLRKGKHFVTIRREGYKAWGKVVTIAGQTARFSMKLKPLSAHDNYMQAGVLAAQGLSIPARFSSGVAAFGALAQSRYVLIGEVKFVAGGKRVSVRAAAFDVVNKKVIASGGAVVGWGTGAAVLARLGQQLILGNDVRLGGWRPGGPKTPPPPRRSNVGLAVGLTIGLAILAGGGVVLALYLTGNLTGPQCSDKGSCIQLELE